MSLASGQRAARHVLADIGDALTTKSLSLFALAGPEGDIDVEANPGHGLYFHDTRFVSLWRLRLNNEPMSVLLSSAEASVSVCELSNRDMQLHSGEGLDRNRVGIRRERHLGAGAREKLTVTNFGSTPLRLTLSYALAADFLDMFAVRGADPGRRGRLHPPRWRGATLLFGYSGADGRKRRTLFSFKPAPTSRTGTTVDFALRIRAGASTTITMTADVGDVGSGELETSPVRSRSRPAARVSVNTDNSLFDRVLQRSFDDLRMLVTRQRRDTFFAAGVPWFVALFGRDSLITALQTLAYEPPIAANTLRLLAKYQGNRVEDYRDEQPGKIPHELRVGEMANLGEVTQTPYYGTVDATPLFIILAAEYLRWTGDVALWRELKPNVERALEWIDVYGDSDGDGFVDYQSRSPLGARNQGWKDSGNGIVDSDGSPAEPPIALVEVQGYVYRARLGAARLFREDGDEERALLLERQAEDLRRRFATAFWSPALKCLVVALQKGGRQVSSLTSNAGQALWSGIVDPDHARLVARQLMSDAMFSGWGVRTLGRGEAAYNPIDYQVGAVWPHDNSFIAAGLRDYGFCAESDRIFAGLFQAATHFRQFRLPELFAGFSQGDYPAPVRYPVACSPQAWAAGAVPYMLRGVLGLEPDALAGVLEVRHPTLPGWLRELTLRDLRVGDTAIDLCYRREGGVTFVAVLKREGGVTVRVRE